MSNLDMVRRACYVTSGARRHLCSVALKPNGPRGTKGAPERLDSVQAPSEEVSDMLACSWPKAVHVRMYIRTRNGRLEHVREHCRSYPSE
jgi:hypothetical protein